jgi:hypothetical protein
LNYDDTQGARERGMKRYNGWGNGERYVDKKAQKVGDERVQVLLRKCAAMQKQMQDQDQAQVLMLRHWVLASCKHKHLLAGARPACKTVSPRARAEIGCVARRRAPASEAAAHGERVDNARQG